jgi:hypothetical protein
MATTTLQRTEYRADTPAIEVHEHDLIHDLGRRLGCLWQYDRCIANADGHPELQAFWRDAKWQEQRSIEQLKKLIQQLVQSNCL